MQDVSEIIKKVRRVEIVANRAVNDLFAGQYRSVFRGQGMEFSEVREYEPGDDIRLIDWNVTAREGRPYIKHFAEERELTVMFLVDISASGMFGSNRSKLDAAVEIAATLMFSALKNNDKVGLVTFCEQIERHFVPRKGKGNVLRMIRELLACEPVAKAADLDAALEHITKTEKRRCVIFLLSDFLFPEFIEPPKTGSLGRIGSGIARTFNRRMNTDVAFDANRRNQRDRFVHKSLSVCRRRHDLIALSVIDPRELVFPNIGIAKFKDAETGQTIEIDTTSLAVRNWIADNLAQAQHQISETFRKAGVDQLQIRTDEDFLVSIRRFFKIREQRFR